MCEETFLSARLFVRDIAKPEAEHLLYPEFAGTSLDDKTILALSNLAKGMMKNDRHGVHLVHMKVSFSETDDPVLLCPFCTFTTRQSQDRSIRGHIFASHFILSFREVRSFSGYEQPFFVVHEFH